MPASAVVRGYARNWRDTPRHPAVDAEWMPCDDYPLSWQILDPDADEVLLRLMELDDAATHSGWEEREWIRERKRNPVPWLVFIDDKRRERDARLAKEAERAARKAEQAAERKRQWAAETAERNERLRQEWAEIDRQEAEAKRQREEWKALPHEDQRREWIDLFKAMRREISRGLAAPHRRYYLLDTIRREMAMIRDYPAGPLPWIMCRRTFRKTWDQRIAEADMKARYDPER